MEALIKLLLNSFFGGTIRKYLEETYLVKSETWPKTNNAKRVKDIELLFGELVFRLTEDPGIDKTKEMEIVYFHTKELSHFLKVKKLWIST